MLLTDVIVTVLSYWLIKWLLYLSLDHILLVVYCLVGLDVNTNIASISDRC